MNLCRVELPDLRYLQRGCAKSPIKPGPYLHDQGPDQARAE